LEIALRTPRTSTFTPDESQQRIIAEANALAKAAAGGGRNAPDELVERWTQESSSSAGYEPKEHRMVRPILFLDIDDVLALNTHFGGRQVRSAMLAPDQAPAELYERVFSRPAIESLNVLVDEFSPAVVMTTSWLALLEKEHFVRLFRHTGVHITDESFHAVWDAPQNYGTSRQDAILRWLQQHHAGEPFLIIDDHSSGEGLVDSFLDDSGRVVLCAVDVGFNSSLLEAARSALQRPFDIERPWLG
jgi:hypothetical protein